MTPDELLGTQLYAIVSLTIVLIGIHIYRDELENRPHQDTGTGIFLVAVLWPFAIAAVVFIGSAAAVIWVFKKLYEIKL